MIDNVTLGLRAKDAEERGRAALAEVGLAGRERAWPNELSGGEQQRAALARSLVRDPQLLLADEPFGALDALTRIKMHELLQQLCERHQPTVLLVTHDVDEAIVLADRVIVLDEGRIQASIEVELGTERAQADPRFAELRTRLLRLLGVDERHGAPRADRRRPHERRTTAAPERLPDEHGSPRGVVAAAGERPVHQHRRPTLQSAGADRRARQDGLRLLRRQPDAVGRHRTSTRPVRSSRPCCWRRSAMATERIGLIATASTTYNEPFNLARRFASLDHISGGRAGWNIVTTATLDAARNFGLDELPGHAARYRGPRSSSTSYAELWDSWDDDAAVGDKEAGVWGDGDRVRTIDHVGEHFGVRGPLNLPRSPQGHPVLVQAGSSEDGKELRRDVRRGDLHRPADAGGRAGVLRGHQAASGADTGATPDSSRSCRASSRSSGARRKRRRGSMPDSTS